MTLRAFLAVALLVLAAVPARAQVDARMFRYPDVSETEIAFLYAGDIWVVPKTGGTAVRLSSPAGEETFPRFSPDGAAIAFSGNYHGNTDLYVVPTRGGLPRRVTHHPMDDRMLDWYPDGRGLLYASSMESGRQRFNQLYRVDAEGGLAEKLPVPYGEFGAISPDGAMLAYIPISRDFRTWKRYRGGMAPDIWIFDLERGTATNVTNHDANDSQPMWHGRTLYFLSDRDANQRANIWAYEVDGGRLRQVTHETAFDVHFPAIGPSDLVYEAGGRLYRMDLATEQVQEVPVQVVTDEATLQPRVAQVSGLIQNAWVAPDGKRVVFEARGELFSVPAEHGPVFNLTRSSGVAERYPAWSPDGRRVAYFSDRSGEYELTVRAADGSGEETRLTTLGAGYRYQPFWSPDGNQLAFIDQAMRIHLYDTATRQTREIGRQSFLYEGGLDNFRVSWSPDSRWLAYAGELDNRSTAIVLYDTQERKAHQVTSGYYSDSDPAFDPEGKYLYFLSSRTLEPAYGDIDNSWIYPNTTNVVAVPLRKDVPSPLAPRNDVVAVPEEKADAKPEEKQDDQDAKADAPAPVAIDLDGFEQRAVVLPAAAGNYTGLQAAAGKVVYHRRPRTGSAEEQAPVVYFDLESREEKTVLGDADGFLLTADGKKLLAASDGAFAVVDLAADQQLKTPLRTAEMEMTVEPRAEWRQIFNDAWRFERDFFYDAEMHGVDWDAMRERYGRLIDDAVTRWDVNYVLGELIGELNASHTYRGGGDAASAPQRGTGLLGVDWALENGAYRIRRIIDGAPWDSEVRSPLARPGVDVHEGDYVLAVNGTPLDPARDPWAAFDGTAGETVQLTVNDRPTQEGARQVLVETLTDETRLRHLAWIEANRRRVEEASDGRIGYIYVPSTGIDGQTELVRQFRAQYTKDGLIIDERFNSGGQIPDRFIELLNRPPVAFWAVRDGKTWQWPPVAHFGPKAMLINGWSGSGGDAFPYYFKQAGLGPLIGTRTWGGLIGITGAPTLIDGGAVTVPTFRMYSPEGTWFPEGYGVEPDIEIVDDPAVMATGRDPQLERAVEEVLRLLEENPSPRPAPPAREDRTARGR